MIMDTGWRINKISDLWWDDNYSKIILIFLIATLRTYIVMRLGVQLCYVFYKLSIQIYSFTTLNTGLSLKYPASVAVS